MRQLDDAEIFLKIHTFTYAAAFTYADTRAGYTDKDKRERVRLEASRDFPATVPKVAWWAFRIFVKKRGRTFDIENIPKLIVDAFSGWQIKRDGSRYHQLGLYPDDTIDYVRLIQVSGERTDLEDRTIVEIFGHNLDA